MWCTGYGKVAVEPIALSPGPTIRRGQPVSLRSGAGEKLLDEAGWKPGPDGIRVKDGQRLELTLLVSKKVLNDALIPIAKENWRQIGVVLKPQVVDFNALMAQRKAGNYDRPPLAPARSTTRTTAYGISTALKPKSRAITIRRSIS